MYDTLFVQPWPFWVAGLAIGLFVPFFAWTTGRLLGISSGYAELCALGKPATGERWKLWFALGLPLGGFIANRLSGGAPFTTRVDEFSSLMPSSPTAQLAVLALGGILIGWGARRAGGCTSGHSIAGIALGARSSMVATIGFMVGGFAVTWLARLWVGGGA